MDTVEHTEYAVKIAIAIGSGSICAAGTKNFSAMLVLIHREFDKLDLEFCPKRQDILQSFASMIMELSSSQFSPNLLRPIRTTFADTRISSVH